nr:putative ribonuclease H-like domain-containing protein [Tanacetum cinerariifolium]
MKKELFAHQETISILSQQKEAQIKLYKLREDKEIDKVIALENKVKVLDNIVYKTSQSVQTMNMLNRNCKKSFAKPEFLKKAQRVNPRLYDIGCYNDNLALMLAPESDEVIRLEKKSRSKLSDLIRPFDYEKLNNLYDLFVPQREKSSAQRYFSERSKMSHTPVNIENSKESFNKQTSLLEKRMDESIHYDQKCKSSQELFKLKKSVRSIIGGVERESTIFSDSLEKKDCSKSKSVTKINVSNDFPKPVTALILPPNKKSILKNTNVIAPGMYKLHTEHTQTRTTRLPHDIRKTNKSVSFSTGVISTTSVKRPQLKCNQLEDRVMFNNSQGKKQEVEEHRRNVKFFKNKMSITACNDSLNAKSLNVNCVCVTCGKCVLYDNHDKCVLYYRNDMKSRTKMPMAVPISTREHKRITNQSVAKPIRKIVTSEYTNQKPRRTIRKLYEHLVEIILFIVNSGYSKHMTGNLKLLTNFVEKFLGTVKFGNDQIAHILGYGDLVQGTFIIKRVYYVEGLNHNLFSVGQFCDADLKVAFRKSTCYIHDLKGNDLLTGINHQTSVARTPKQNDVVERRNRTLVEAARTMLSAAKVPLFFWADAIATTCFTQNRSLVIPRHEKTPYHIIND